MALDDSMLSPSGIAVNPEPVAESLPWGIFELARKSYEEALQSPTASPFSRVDLIEPIDTPLEWRRLLH